MRILAESWPPQRPGATRVMPGAYFFFWYQKITPMQLGIIREGKTPPDSRVPLIPEQAARVAAFDGVKVTVQPSPGRCFPDSAYAEAGLSLGEDVQDCDVLMGVKEVPIDQLIPDKTYFFFSHTIKEQAYNRDLLRAVLDHNIRLLDYEVLTNDRGARVIAFGRFAGMVGAHNALYAYAQRTGDFALPRMNSLYDYAAAKEIYRNIDFSPLRIVLTGTGRVGNGAAEVLDDMGIRRVAPKEFLTKDFGEAVYTQLQGRHYAERADGSFERAEFFKHPGRYRSRFAPYARRADIFINGIYWHNEAPAFFTVEEMRAPDFRIRTIADVTCDIAPVTSVPATLRASTIADPLFGFDPQTGEEAELHQPHVIDMMTVDNLPNELPRDASRAFGEQFLEHVWPELYGEYVGGKPSALLRRATVAWRGELGPNFQYLENYVGPR